MEDWVCVHRYAPIPLDHSSAAVSLDTHHLDMPAMVIQSPACHFSTFSMHDPANDHLGSRVYNSFSLFYQILMNVLRAPVAAHSCVITPLEVISVCAIQAIIRPLITLPV